MATTSARTVSEYLRSLDPERRKTLSAVRKVVNDNLPEGYVEGVVYGIIAWSIPLSTFPDTYNGQPLCCAALAANKNYNSLHLMGAAYGSKQKAFLRQEFEKRGKRFDMGQGCLRFRTLDDLPLDVIGEVIRRVPAKELIAIHEAAHGNKKARTRARTRRKAR
jgi:Domain of unknown function (DU1801)